jgi:hypothetical protein
MAKQAWYKRLLTLTRKPTVAVTSNRFVDGAGNQLTVANTRALGISQDDYDATDLAQNPQQGVAVTIMGIEELEVGAATVLNGFLTTDASGRGVNATTGQIVNAIGLEAGTAAGDRIPALIIVGPVLAP